MSPGLGSFLSSDERIDRRTTETVANPPMANGTTGAAVEFGRLFTSVNATTTAIAAAPATWHCDQVLGGKARAKRMTGTVKTAAKATNPMEKFVAGVVRDRGEIDDVTRPSA